MAIRLNTLDKEKNVLEFFRLVEVTRRGELVVFSQRETKRKFIVGRLKCPYCGEVLELSIARHDTPGGPSLIQMDSDFKNHMELRHGEDFRREWIKEVREPYQPGSWHRVKRYVCLRCGFKSRRYADVLIHIVVEHGFGC